MIFGKNFYNSAKPHVCPSSNIKYQEFKTNFIIKATTREKGHFVNIKKEAFKIIASHSNKKKTEINTLNVATYFQVSTSRETIEDYFQNELSIINNCFLIWMLINDCLNPLKNLPVTLKQTYRFSQKLCTQLQLFCLHFALYSRNIFYRVKCKQRQSYSSTKMYRTDIYFPYFKGWESLNGGEKADLCFNDLNTQKFKFFIIIIEKIDFVENNGFE
ncbi:hypothetical protein AGLY_006224 [Aphis glycines]|uniref:Uncharacterized protein n=1 Tax=Aphis glycines TaxID=307491 RepID=A0A6G0TSS4_APHGL|nr:hypothetical protein AGLY_006224 [Aphis glycines]